LVFLKNWSARITPEGHRLAASTADFSFRLEAVPLKGPIAHGEAGYSRKGSTKERASCYYSFTRLGIEGSLDYRGESIPVSGTAWMDHEYSTAPLEEDLEGWDWFSLQLSDGTEVMLYLLRRKGGGLGEASSGTFVDEAGVGEHLPLERFQVEVLDRWTSLDTGARYPSQWRVSLPGKDLEVTVTPNLADQEMRTEATTQVTYWEGSVSVQGRARGQPVTGRGYVELTGYAEAFDAPL
jgi:predicted secreted hydrolase